MNKGVNIPDGWREVELEEVFLFLRTSSYSRSQTSKASKNALYIHYGDIHKINNLTLDFKKENILRLNDDIDSSSLDFLQNGDLIVADASEDYLGIGSCSEIKNLNELAVSGLHTFALRPNINFIKTGFSSLLLNSFFVKNHLKKIATGASVLGISKYYLARTPLLIPPLQEQKAIADILEKWDEAIEKTSKLIVEKKKRFEWIRKFLLTTKKDWKNIKLKDFLTESSQRSQIENEYKILSSTMNNIEIRSGRVDAISNIGYKIIRKNQLVLSPQNLWLGNINVNTDYEIGLVSPSYKIFDFNENIMLSDFAKFLFKTNKMLWNYKLCSEVGASVVRRNLDLDLFYEIKIYTPALEQQKQIAKTLNTAKKEITILEGILAKYKNQKKGLMQKLLTGKIRVNNINLEIRK